MAFTSRTRLVNPRLGTYFGIFAAAFAALVLMALMFEQLGAADVAVRLAHVRRPHRPLRAPSASAAPRTRDGATTSPAAAGCRPSSTGWCSASRALGGAGFLALTGALFIVGFDALCLSIGWYAGLVFMGVLFAPFLRKFGAYTVPTFLGRRFESRTRARRRRRRSCRCRSCCCWRPRRALPPTPRPGCSGQSERLMAALVVACAAAIVLAGGMRSLTWSSVAKAIAALLALAVPRHHRRPHGLQPAAAADDARQHAARAHPHRRSRAACRSCWPRRWPFDLPGEGIEPLVKRFIQAFGSVGSLSFVLMSFVVAAGIAASPVAAVARRAPRPASTRRASRSAGPCWSSASCC